MYLKYQLKRTVEKATFDKTGFQEQVNRCYKGVREAQKALEQEALPLPKPLFSSSSRKKDRKAPGKEKKKK